VSRAGSLIGAGLQTIGPACPTLAGGSTVQAHRSGSAPDRESQFPGSHAAAAPAILRRLPAFFAHVVGCWLEQTLDVTDSAIALDLEAEWHTGRNRPTAIGLIHFSIATRFDGVQTA
jgi:hypothetical protein